MKPETIRKLQENVPELRELVEFIAAEVAVLDTLSGLAELSFTERAYETTSRIRAKDVLMKVLGPLITPVDNPVGTDPGEYVT